MNNISNRFLNFVVTVTTTDNKGVVGELVEVDSFGLLVRAEVESEHEIKEKVAVYVPHKDVKMIHAKEDDNLILKFVEQYENLFGTGR